MKTKTKILTAVAISVLALTPQLGATTVTSTTFAAWTGTTSADSEWTFTFPNGGSYDTAAGYSLNTSSSTYGTTNVKGPNGSGYTLNEGTYVSGGRNYQSLQSASNGIGTMVFTAAAGGLTAADLGLGISGNSAPVTITLSDGETFIASPTVGGILVWGFSSSTDITSFTLSTTSGTSIDLADFYAGTSTETAAETPTVELATAIMVGSGLVLLGARRKVFSNLSRA